MKNMGLNLSLLEGGIRSRKLDTQFDADRYKRQAEKDFAAQRSLAVTKAEKREVVKRGKTFFCKTFLCAWEGLGKNLWHGMFCPCCGGRVYQRRK